MKRLLQELVLFVVCALATAGAAGNPASAIYEEALDLIHAYSGSGDELSRAMQLAEALSKSEPKSGYAQALFAEALSTWRLDQRGQPFDVFNQVIAIANEALELNPRLAPAHVAKARAFVRFSSYQQATSSIDAALSIDPMLSGALFLRAEVFRRNRALDDAEVWYRKFIESTASATRKSNGYYWLGKMYQDEAWYDPNNRQAFIAKARVAYESMLRLDSGGAWRNVNFAIFLNDYAADFDAAELYAQKALDAMEFPMARYHFAAAQYQKLGATASSIERSALSTAVSRISASSGISLVDAIAFQSFSPVVRDRLQALQARLSELPR